MSNADADADASAHASSSESSVTNPETSVPENVADMAAKVSNWGRWGADDELGCGNLLDSAATMRGTGAVRSNRVVSLAVDLKADGIQIGQPARRFNPILTVTSLNERDQFSPGIWEGTDDMVMMSTCAGTHIDALSHISYDKQLYNGFSVDVVSAQGGATKLGAEKLPSIATRGILLDLPGQRGLAGLDEQDPSFAVTPDVLDAALEELKLSVQPGDVLLIRTGEMRHYLAGDRKRYAVGDQYRFPGIALEAAEWFHRHDVAGVFTDTYAYEVFPPAQPDWSDTLAVHMVQVRDMGLLQGQNWDLESLAVACAEQEQWEFLLLAGPEPLVGATSAPVVPLAIL